MAVVFTEGKAIPPQVKAMGGYRGFGDTGQDIANIVQSLTTGAVDFFGGTTSQAKQAQAQAAMMQAQVMGQESADAAQTKRYLIIAAAGVAGIFLLASALRRPAPMAGYRRRKRSRR